MDLVLRGMRQGVYTGGFRMKTKIHEYLRRLELSHSMGLIDNNCLDHAIIAHDDYCKIYLCEYCDCDPDITIKVDGGEVKIDSNGHLFKEDKP